MKKQTTEWKWRKLLKQTDVSNRAYPMPWRCFSSYSYFPELFKVGFLPVLCIFREKSTKWFVLIQNLLSEYISIIQNQHQWLYDW